MKKIRAYTHHPILLTECVWCDVWLCFFVGKRKKKKLAPCFMSLSAIENDIEKNKWVLSKSETVSLCGETFDITALHDDARESLKCLMEMKEKLHEENMIVYAGNIYVNQQILDRQAVENGIRLLLSKEKIGQYRIKWKTSKFFITPV